MRPAWPRRKPRVDVIRGLDACRIGTKWAVMSPLKGPWIPSLEIPHKDNTGPAPQAKAAPVGLSPKLSRLLLGEPPGLLDGGATLAARKGPVGV